MEKIYGGCLCGAVRYEMDELPLCTEATDSDCSDSGILSWGLIKTDSFRWLAGDTALGRSPCYDRAAKTFCTVCGSSMQLIVDGLPANVRGLSLDTLEGAVSRTGPVLEQRRVCEPGWQVFLDLLEELPES